MGWLPTSVVVTVLVVVGIVLLDLLALRLRGALRRTRLASRTLNTSVTGRARRIHLGFVELRVWRAARRQPAALDTAVTGPPTG